MIFVAGADEGNHLGGVFGLKAYPLPVGALRAAAALRGPATLALAGMLVVGLLGVVGCTNYSAEEPIVNPPILLGLTSPTDTTLAIAAEGTGHILRVRAINQEIGFAGYRLYQASTDAAVRALSVDAGTDCGPLAVSPVSSVEYIIEVKPGQSTVTPGLTDNRLCAMNTTLVSGNYVLLRSLIFRSPVAVSTSIPSNSAVVP